MSHTPGPWQHRLVGFSEAGAVHQVLSDNGAVCDFVNDADAILIAAAPDLLAALTDALAALESHPPSVRGNEIAAGKVRAAIAKATGSLP